MEGKKQPHNLVIQLYAAATAAKLLHRLCATPCDPIDGSPPCSPVPGILQARTLEWVAIFFSNAWSEKWKCSRSVMSNSSRSHGLQPTRLLCPWDFPGKSTGVGCHCLLQFNYILQFKLGNKNTKKIRNKECWLLPSGYSNLAWCHIPGAWASLSLSPPTMDLEGL